ncbi:cochlin-like [Montipora capricornis]|uniref:cochlin-like n=1 Tax=Montipora capricornis TaxID=246305 RepID=UPI0035F14F8B
MTLDVPSNPLDLSGQSNQLNLLDQAQNQAYLLEVKSAPMIRSGFFIKTYSFLHHVVFVATRNSSTGVSHIPVTADIAFLIDGSHYVGRRNFHLEKAFIKSIARRFTIAKHNSHIGVATYGSRPQLHIRFNKCGSFGLLLKVLDCIRYPNQNGQRVDLGMNAALRYFFKKRYKYSFVQNILVVIVNGRQTGRSCHIMRRHRWQFAKLGVKVYVVGVGRIDYRYFRPITYKNRHVYTVRSYRSLVTRAGQIG